MFFEGLIFEECQKEKQKECESEDTKEEMDETCAFATERCEDIDSHENSPEHIKDESQKQTEVDNERQLKIVNHIYKERHTW